MAVIDLKNVTVKIRDGGVTVNGAVNKPVGPEISPATAASSPKGMATLSLKVGGIGGAHTIGEKFLITGDDTVYTLTRDLGATDVTAYITPILQVVIESAKVITFQPGYGENATKIAVDGFSDTLSNGSILNFGTDTTDYLITSTTGGAMPTLITISPGLKDEIADNAVVKVVTSPHSIIVTVGDGDISWSEKTTREYKLNRGRLDTVRNADEEPMEVSLNSLTFEFVMSDSTATIDTPSLVEAITGTGPAANWASTSSDPCEPYCVDIILENVPGCGNTGASETFIFPDFRKENIDYNTKDGSITITGKCNRTEALKIRNIL